MCLAVSSLLSDTGNSAHTNGTYTPKTRTHKYDVNQISLERKLTQYKYFWLAVPLGQFSIGEQASKEGLRLSMGNEHLLKSRPIKITIECILTSSCKKTHAFNNSREFWTY